MAVNRSLTEAVTTVPSPWFVVLLLAFLPLAITGCSTTAPAMGPDGVARGRILESIPSAPQDTVLTMLGTLPAGKAVRLRDGETALAQAAYDAASGRRCRRVDFGQGATGYTKLACGFSNGWRWVPSVLP